MGQIYSIPARERRERIAGLLGEYDLRRLRDRRPATMSGGERQRLALAAAVLHRPDLLLLDEPTSAVDPESRRRFWGSLFKLVDTGTTILISTHYMDEAERCHRLAILDRGRLAAEGEPQELADGIDAGVVEVRTDQVRAVRERLMAEGDVLSVAQFGSRLHVLMRRERQQPVEWIGGLLREAGVAGEARAAEPGLEDVFVAATRQVPGAGNGTVGDGGAGGGAAPGSAVGAGEESGR
jgi:ABC-2 type transport system ATP-binding protein